MSINKIITYIDTVLKSWILGIRDKSLKGCLYLTLLDGEAKKELRYFIKIAKEFTRKGYHLVGVLIIELKRKIVNHENSEKKIGRYIINLGAFLRSTRSEVDVDTLKLLGNIFSARGVQDVIVPIYYLPELKIRLKPILQDIKDDLISTLGNRDISIQRISLKITSKKAETTTAEVLTDLMKIIISQYIDVSELNLLERDLRRSYGIVDEEIGEHIIKRWHDSLKEILKLLISYSIILFRDDRFEKIKFLEALSKSLTPNKVKIALKRFIILAKRNVDEKTYNTFLNDLRKILQGTTLEGFDTDVDYFLAESTFPGELDEYIRPNLENFSRNLPQILSIIRKKGDLDKALGSAINEIIIREDLSEDDKVVSSIIITLLLKPSKLRTVLYNLKGHMLCEACPGAKLVNIVNLALSKPSKKLLDEITFLIFLLIYSNELRYETYRLYLLLAYIFKALIAHELSMNKISKSCLETAKKLVAREKTTLEKIIWSVLTWKKATNLSG